ncbi:putative leucine-rich repeat domain superfamily [Arabidopsis thaliana]
MEKSLETVPGLDLSGEDIEMYYQYVRFVDRFLRFNRNYQIEYFKLSYPGDGSSEREVDLLKRWIDTVIQLKVKDLDFFDYSWEWGFDNFQLPSTIYICESLVSLKLSTVTLPSVKSVSLPFLRVLKLGAVKFADHLDLETLISGCTALETLAIRFFDRVQVLQVSSQSLLSFTHVAPKLVFTHAVRKPLAEKDLSIVIDAPRLEYLKLSDHQTASFIIKNPGSLVAVDIDINLSSGFDSRNMIRDFLVGISSVKNRTISSITLKIIYDYLRCEPLPPHSVIYISCMLSSTTTGLKCCQPFLRSAQI